MTANERRILLLCGWGHFYSHFYMLAFPSLAMWIQKEFGLPFGDVVALGFWMYLLYGVAALPFAYWATKVPSRPLLAGAIFSTGGFAVAAGFADSTAALHICLAGIGLSAAAYHPIGTALISRCCRNRGAALGRNGVWGSTALAGAPLFAGVAATAIGWRGAFWVSGGLATILGFGLWHRHFNEDTVSSNHQRTPRAGVIPAFAIMLGCMTMLGFCYRSTAVVLPAWFRLRADLAPGAATGDTDFMAAMMVALSYACGIAGQLTGGKIADRYDLRVAYLCVHAAAMSLTAASSLLPRRMVSMPPCLDKAEPDTYCGERVLLT